MVNYTVAVTGLSAADDPNSGIPVLRSLKCSEGWAGRTIGLSYDPLDTGLYNESLIDEIYLLPWSTEGAGALLQRLREINEKVKIDVIIPNLDGELLNYIRLEDELKDLGIHLLVPAEDKLRMQFKITLGEFCKENGFAFPKSIAITDPQQIKDIARELGFPFIIKGILHEAHVAYSIEEAKVFFQQIRVNWGLPLLIQEYLKGDPRNVVAVTDKSGQLIGSVAMRKLFVTEKGKGWSGVTIYDEELEKLTRDILKKLGWVGPLELEFIKDRTTGKCYLLEINPRFPAWVYLAARAGQNLPLAVVELAMGKKLEPFKKYQTGVIFVRQSIDLICPLEHLAQLTSEGTLILNKRS